MFSCKITFSGLPLSAPRLKSRCDPFQAFRKPTGVGFRNWLNPRRHTVTFLVFRNQVVIEHLHAFFIAGMAIPEHVRAKPPSLPAAAILSFFKETRADLLCYREKTSE
jgi:hypothetical protein